MRIEQITFTRFLAAISIVIFHYGKNIFPFNNSTIFFLFDRANIGVSYFFILSGFVMIIAYHKKGEINFLEYLKIRFARIYPVYLFAILVLLVYQIKHNYSIDYSGLLLNVIAVQAWVPGKALSFNTPGWSLSVEFFFYVIFPVLFNSVFRHKKKLKRIGLLVVLIWLISQIVLHWFLRSSLYHGYPSNSHDLIYYFPLMHLNEFIIGNLAGLIFIKRYKGENRNYDLHILLIAAAIIITLKYALGLNFHNGMMSFLFVPLIYFISSNQGILTSFFKSKALIFLGEISYGIYILQLPVFLWSGKIFQHLHIDNPSVKFYSFLVLLIMLSAISYIVIETPLRRKIRNLSLPKMTAIKCLN